MCLCAQVANRFLEEGNVVGYERWCDAALYDAPGITVLQEYVGTTKEKRAKLDPHQIVTLRKQASANEASTETVRDETKVVSGDPEGPPNRSLPQGTSEAEVGEEPVVSSLPVKDADVSVLPGKTTVDQPSVHEKEEDGSPAHSEAIQPKPPSSDQGAND
jgi:hypothetical protein